MKITIALLLIAISNILVAQNLCQSGDCINGYGKVTYGNYGVYVGNFINGKKNGEGMYAYMIGKDTSNVYRGNFKDDEFFGKGSFHVIPFCTYYSDSWTDHQNFTSGTEVRDDTKQTYTGAYVKLFFERKNNDVIQINTDNIYTGTVMGNNITHSVKIINLAMGRYSEVFKTDMIGKLAQGFKRYFVCVDSRKYAKKYHQPFGASYFYQLINDKNEVVSQQVKESTSNDDCCYFGILPEGKYTIQVAYDFHNVLGDGERLSGLKLVFTLYSNDFTYTKFLKN